MTPFLEATTEELERNRWVPGTLLSQPLASGTIIDLDDDDVVLDEPSEEKSPHHKEYSVNTLAHV